MSLVAVSPPFAQADRVFIALRAEILSCRLAPGTKIRINDIAERFEVSSGAVREALPRLTAEGLTVTQEKKGYQKGYAVAPVSNDELVDLTNTRISIEQLCLRDAIEHGGVDWEAEIVATCHRLSRIPERDPDDPRLANETWSATHAAFHFALAAGCKSKCLLRIRDGLYAQSERYRRLSVPLLRGERNVDAEHKTLADAMLRRNADHACGLISDHLWRTTRIILDSPLLTDAAEEND